MKIEQFKDFSSISNLKYHDQKLYYTLTKPNLTENRYDATIHAYDLTLQKDFVLTNTGKETSFEILEDGSLLFPRKKEPKDPDSKKEETLYYRLGSYGEAQEFFTVPLADILSIHPVNKDCYLFVQSFDRKKVMESIKDEKNQEDKEISVEEIEEIPFWFNGSGFTRGKRSRLGIYIPSTNQYRYITDDFSNVSSVKLNKEKTAALFTMETHTFKMPLVESLYRFDISTGKLTQLEKNYSYYTYDFLQDNIITLKSDNKIYGINEDPNLYIDNTCLTENSDYSYFNTIGKDLNYGSSRQFKVVDNQIYVLITDEYRSKILSFTADGKENVLYETEFSVEGFELNVNELYIIEMTDTTAQEIYLIKDGQKKRLTKHNEFDLTLAKREMISFTNDDLSFKGWILYPKNFDPKKKYPGLLFVHGGPKTVYGNILFHEMEVFTENEYFVFFTNPRGSSGRGNEFADIRGKYGDCDFSDLMHFTDLVLEKIPQIDKIGYTGGSYGGFMANWVITHTDRFSAACSQRSISNWTSMMNISDIGYFFVPDQTHSTFEDAQKHWNNSPLKYAKNATTPTLFIHSAEDYRCPVAEGIQMFTMLKYYGVDSKLVLFHGENHALSRFGKPKHRIKRIEEILQWFEHYLR